MPQRQQTLQEAVGRAQWVGVPRRQALCTARLCCRLSQAAFPARPLPSMGDRRPLTILGGLVLGCEDDGAARPPRVREGVAVLLELVLGEQVVPEAAIQGGPWGPPGQAVSPQRGWPRGRRRAFKRGRGGWESARRPLCHRPGSPFRSSTRGLVGRLIEKLVLAANLPPSTTSWDTTLRPPLSGRGRECVNQAQTPSHCPGAPPPPRGAPRTAPYHPEARRSVLV